MLEGERKVLGYLWHFERFNPERSEEKDNLKIFKGFANGLKSFQNNK